MASRDVQSIKNLYSTESRIWTAGGGGPVDSATYKRKNKFRLVNITIFKVAEKRELTF